MSAFKMIVSLAGIGAAALTVAWIALLIYLDSRGMELRPRPLARLTRGGRRLARRRLAVDERRLAVEELELREKEAERRHRVVQKELVLDDLEHERLKRALNRGSEDA